MLPPAVTSNFAVGLGLSLVAVGTYSFTIYKMKQGSVASDFPDNVPAKQAGK
jgi:hypothetical protein